MDAYEGLMPIEFDGARLLDRNFTGRKLTKRGGVFTPPCVF